MWWFFCTNTAIKKQNTYFLFLCETERRISTAACEKEVNHLFLVRQMLNH